MRISLVGYGQAKQISYLSKLVEKNSLTEKKNTLANDRL